MTKSAEFKTNIDLVKDFMIACGQKVETKLTKPDDDNVRLRLSLILEEVIEMFDACLNNNHIIPQIIFDKLGDAKTLLEEKVVNEDIFVDYVKLADALADIEYINSGTALTFGINQNKVFQEVHRSNMSKVDPATGSVKRRQDGKILKPESYSPPNIESILELIDNDKY